MAGNELEILKTSRFRERILFWNGYVRKENQRYGALPKTDESLGSLSQGSQN